MEVIHISRQDLENLKLPLDAVISGTKYLASYNWIDSNVPTIAIPGCPALWTPPSGCQPLPKDTGFYYIAQNAARHPESPLEPLFRGIVSTDPAFDMADVDVVTDRNNLRKLLSFAAKHQLGRTREAFTINFELVGQTLLMCRDEVATSEYIEPDQFRGFGHEFEKAYTTSQICQSTGHHRIISYNFSGLKLIVRHETDGFVSADSTGKNDDAEDGDLAAMIVGLSLSATVDAPYQYTCSSGLRVQKLGREVPLDSTLEIKTRTIGRPLALSDIAPQLWISQTPKLVRAYHRGGLFRTPSVEDVALNIQAWESESQPDLRRFAAVIREIAVVAKRLGGRASCKYDVTGDKLIFRRFEGACMLPEDLYRMWSGKSSDSKVYPTAGHEQPKPQESEEEDFTPDEEEVYSYSDSS